MLSASDATKYAKPASSKPIAYGTAGFRARAETLESTFYRMGMLAVLRSRARGGLASGLMVTASHNPEPDNGIKLVDTDGGMLHQSWEGFATRLANADEVELHARAVDAVELILHDDCAPENGPESVEPPLERLGVTCAV